MACGYRSGFLRPFLGNHAAGSARFAGKGRLLCGKNGGGLCERDRTDRFGHTVWPDRVRGEGCNRKKREAADYCLPAGN